MFPMGDYTYLHPDAAVTFKGRILKGKERTDFFALMNPEFLLAFDKLSPEQKVAVRLRYGQDILGWYTRKE
jgi:hypothetical protein